MKLELTERDRKLIQTINDYGLLSTGQIRCIFFPGVDHSVVMRRLRRLKSKKYLHASTGLPKGELVWTLALKARQLIHSDLEVTVNKNQIEHDILISEIRLRLERAHVCHSWVSGFRLKQLASKKEQIDGRKPSQVPDGLFSVQMPYGIQIVALELELVSKTKRRYKDILENHARNSKVHWVWYVIIQKSLGSFLCEAANTIQRPNNKKWLFISNLSDVLNPKSSVILNNQNHSILLVKGDQADDQPLVSQK
jgi:hypothetical protein